MPRRLKQMPVEPPARVKKHVRVKEEPDFKPDFMPYELEDIWHISPDITRTIRDEYGYELFWAAETVLGQEQTRLMSHRRRNGCADVHRGSFGGLVDYLFDSLDIRDNEPRIAKEGLVLMAQPTDRVEQARAYQRQKARAQVEEMKTKHSNEGVDVSMPGGGRDPSARRQNRHSQHFEPFDPIPEQ